MQSGWRKAVLALFSALALCAAWAISARGQGQAVTGLATGPVDPAGPATAGDDWPSDVSQPFWDDGAYSDYVARFGIGHVIGQGVGYEDSFTTFDFLLPLIEEPNQSLFFSDLRLNLNNQATVAANVGLGFRQYLEDWNRTIGFLVYYDYRDTRQNGFHQLGFGFESLGVWDFRSNVYLPNLFDDDQTSRCRAVFRETTFSSTDSRPR
ncbi:MAG: hypothetical protein GXP27_11290 [Planctomycetes bacterium]|nr:hypothetical protein [Planctomycetota bacterium]